LIKELLKRGRKFGRNHFPGNDVSGNFDEPVPRGAVVAANVTFGRSDEDCETSW
jgi:hypothetical protein